MSHILIALFAHSICTSTPANPLFVPRSFGILSTSSSPAPRLTFPPRAVFPFLHRLRHNNSPHQATPVLRTVLDPSPRFHQPTIPAVRSFSLPVLTNPSVRATTATVSHLKRNVEKLSVRLTTRKEWRGGGGFTSCPFGLRLQLPRPVPYRILQAQTLACLHIVEIVLSRLVEGERREVGHHLVLPDPAVQCHRPGKGVGVVRRSPANKGQYAR